MEEIIVYGIICLGVISVLVKIVHTAYCYRKSKKQEMTHAEKYLATLEKIIENRRKAKWNIKI